MHVCAESRAVAQRHLYLRETRVPAGTASCRPSEPVQLAYRPYRPATDIFYVHSRDFDAFVDVARNKLHELDEQRRASSASDDSLDEDTSETDVTSCSKGELTFPQDVAHLAIDATVLDHDFVPELEELIPVLTSLRKLSVVFGPSFWKKDKLTERRRETWSMARRQLVPVADDRTRARAEAFLANFEMQTALWEIQDENEAPWNPQTGEWLFEIAAVQMTKAPGIV